MYISLISKYKKQLMAIAMLWIAIYHSNFPIHSRLITFVLVVCGYGGIYLFSFISGMGIFFSCSKEESYGKYIRRRLLRILPYGLPIIIAFALRHRTPLRSILVDCLGLSIFVSPNLINWFTSFIITAYVLSPFYYRLFTKKPLLVTALTSSLITTLCMLINNETISYIYICFTVYCIGFYFGYLIYNKHEPKFLNIVMIFMMVMGWVLMYYCYHHFGNDVTHVYPMIMIAPGMLLIIAFILDKITVFNKLLDFIGSYTYVFYLIHMEVIGILYFNYELLYRPGIYFDVLINAAGIIIAFILSVIYQNMIDLIKKLIIKCAIKDG